VESGDTFGSKTLLRDFTLFTNDLDASGMQSIHTILPELVKLLGEAGFPWVDESWLATERDSCQTR
jgi:hypothetical protein